MSDGRRDAGGRAPNDDAASGFVGRTGITLAGAIGGGALVFLSEIVLARYLGVQQYGLYGLAYTSVKIVEVLSLAGMRATMIHFLPIHRARGHGDELLGALSLGLGVPAILSISLGAALVLFADRIATALFDEPGMAAYLVILALAAPGLALSDIAGNCARAFGHVTHYVVGRSLLPPAAVILIVLGLLAARVEPGPMIVAAIPVGYSLGAALSLYLLFSVVREIGVGAVPRADVAATARYALPVMLNAVLYLAIGWTDIVMLGHFRDAQEVGLYRACMQLIVAFDLVAVALNAATANVYSQLDEQDRVRELEQRHRLAMRLGLGLTLPFLAVIAFNASDLLSLMGDDFRAATGALMVLGLAGLLRGLSGNVGFLLAVTGRQRYELAALVVATGVNISLNYVLIPALGIVGAATATATSMVVLAGLRVHFVRTVARLRPFAPVQLRIAVAVVAATALAWAVCAGAGISPGNGILAFCARLLMLSAALATCIWAVGLLPEERRRMVDALSRGRRRPRTE